MENKIIGFNYNSNVMLDGFGNEDGYDMDMRYVNYRQSGTTTMEIGGVRIGNSFEDLMRGIDTTNLSPTSNELFLTIRDKTIYPSKNMNGDLSIYNVYSSLLDKYKVYGETPIETNLRSGIYIFIYNGENKMNVQKAIIH